MSDQIRALHLAALTGKTRTEWWGGKEHLIVPVVALQEAVIQAMNAETPELVTLAAITTSVDRWNGLPLVVNHPVNDGEPVSANDPATLEKQGFGIIRSAHIKGKKLVMEALVNPERLIALGQTAMLNDLREGRPVSVSVGAGVRVTSASGTHLGKSYEGEWTFIAPDHLAFLPGGRGACSLEMGCGAHRAASHVIAQEEENEMSEPTSIRERLGGLIRSLMPRGWGDDEVKKDLYDALLKTEPNARNGDILRVTNADLVYALYPDYSYYNGSSPLPPTTYWKRGYTYDSETKTFSLSGERTQVEPTTVYEPLRAAQDDDNKDDKEPKPPVEDSEPEPEPKRAACGCASGDENMKEKVTALMANPHNPIKNQKVLEAMTEAELTALEASCTETATLKAAAAAAEKTANDVKTELTETQTKLKAAEDKQKEVDDKLAAMQPIIDEHTARVAAEKTALVTTLKAAQSAYSEEELIAKSVAELQKIATLTATAVPAVDFSGRGVPVLQRAAGTGDNSEFDPPPAYARLMGSKEKAH